MILEVDVALRSLIEREATNGSEVDVVFDAPTKDWAGRRNAPTIDVYLYDIREDLRRRERGLINEYDSRGITARHLPPRYFKLSYLVTAWTQRPEDEHRLLSTLLACFLGHDALPRELLTGQLSEVGMPVPVTVALPPPEDRSFADVWSALGGELKPSLDVVVSAPTDSGQRYVAEPLVDGPMRISLGGVGTWPPEEQSATADHRQASIAATNAAPGRNGTTGRAADVVEATSGSRDSAGPTGAAGSDAGRRGMSWQELAGAGADRTEASGRGGDGRSKAAAGSPGSSTTRGARRGRSGISEKRAGDR